MFCVLAVLLISIVICDSPCIGNAQHPTTAKLGASDAVELSVAAASDVTPAMKEIAAAFERKFNGHVLLTFAESHALYEQIRTGAPFDVFFAADMDEARRLAASEKAGPVRAYARIGLVMCISPMMPIQLPLRNPLVVLRNKAIAHIAIVDPHQTDFGKATVSALRRNHIYDETLRRKFVVGENASQTAEYLLNGSADVALLPSSIAVAGAQRVPIPSSSYVTMPMGAVILKRSKHQHEAVLFLNFASSSAARTTFSRYGFTESKQNSKRKTR